MKSSQQGLNRTELLILFASFSVLALVLLKPIYETYLLKEKFLEVVEKPTERYKQAIELCAKFGECAKTGKLAGMQEGTMGVPDSITTAHIDRIMIASNGILTVKTKKVDGLEGETYVLTPNYSKDAPLTWSVSGTCKTRPGGAIC